MNNMLLSLLHTKKYLPLMLPLFLLSFFIHAFPQDVTSNDSTHAGGQFVRGILPARHYFEDSNVQRYAVVIGISDYKDPKIPDLKYADADAQAFYDFITSPIGGDFRKENVLLLKNDQATLKNVKLAVTNFLKKAIDTDFVVIFMACHGVPEPDRPNNLYLLAHDSELDGLSATAYHMENVNADMKRYISAKRLIFFADTCHSAGLRESAIGTRGGPNTINIALSALRSTREGWGIVSASRAGEVSMESNLWGGGHGVFTHYLLEGMSGKADAVGNKNGIVTLAEAFDFLEEKVKRATQNAQHPDISGNFDNNLPLGFPGIEIATKESDQKLTTPRPGSLQINTAPQGASVYVKGEEVGKTPLDINLASGTYPVTIKMRGYSDVSDTVFINPDEKTEIFLAQHFEEFYFGTESGTSSGTKLAYAESGRVPPEYEESVPEKTDIPVNTEKREETIAEPIVPGRTPLEYAESVRDKADVQKTKENIDALIKELEAMAKEQAKEEKPRVAKKPKEKKPEPTEVPHAVPISIKEFNVKMGALSNRRNTEILRQRIIDALLNQDGLRVVERDLELQEAILREQRLSGSILADEMFRVALGKIQGARFLCFGEVFPGDTPDQRILRMEVVDTATTLMNTFERVFQTDENLRTVANDIAAKIREKVTAKRKL